VDAVELALLCHEALAVEARRALLAARAAGAGEEELCRLAGGALAEDGRLREDLLPGGRRRRRWEELARELVEGPLALLRPGWPDYPPRLAALARPPDPLFALGRPELAAADCVALVGTRRPDEEGRRWTARAARALAGSGLVVVSGGAAGIDAQAHRAAGLERTVAVLGAGFARPYPGEHRGLFAEIARQGLLLSEWPPWTRPDTWRFPRRNRVIAGLCRAVVVVQAPARSGALNTAHHAAEEGREVLVCPGRGGDPLYRGSHRLLREGARLVDGVEDLLEDLGGLPFWGGPAPMAPPPVRQGREDDPLWGALERPRTRDELAALLGLEAGALAGRLLEEELAGRLRSLPGDRWERCA
jgi:DNA processing protein